MTAVAAWRRRAGPVKKAKARGGVLGRILVWLFLLAVVLPVAVVGAYRFVPPPVTALMLIRVAEGHGLDYRWRGLQDISPTLAQAAIASEDSQFCLHHGFDFTAMEKAYAHNEKRPGKVRGGSTISQQTAKNVFLWPDRSYVRKGLEAYFTVLTEALWGKRRIMEVYLNVVEWGPGFYGAEAASQHNFGHSARHLTTSEAAHLVAILPSPLKWKAVNSGAYVQRRAGTVAERVGTVRSDGLSGCVLR
jgi:monofunctional biosynthetic peptidoglycan transglycosylase